MWNYEITSNPKVYFYYKFHNIVEDTFQIEGDEEDVLQFIDDILNGKINLVLSHEIINIWFLFIR